MSPSSASASEPAKPNVLMIAVDDLNHWVGHLQRNPQTKTPNIDRLARMGVSFTRAYCAAPVCNPSRTALLSGKRPSSTGIYDNGQPYQQAVTPDQSLITVFRKAGYRTMGSGKIWHGGVGWAEQYDEVRAERAERVAPKEDRGIGGIAFAPLDCADEDMVDHHTASFGVEELGRSHDKPFFLALGFHKPHMPWNVPRKYYEQFPLDKIELPPYREDDLKDVPAAGVKMAGPGKDHAQVLESGRWKEAIQAYLAAISFLDGQIGRVLDGLEKGPNRDNTIICFWGDHGWHLGEKHHWRKFALWEEATRAPLIWVAPGLTKPGGRCERAVDFMSIYPTLCDLAGVAKPGHVEGESLRTLLADPAAAGPGRPALTTHGFRNHAVRDERWRYIRYAGGGEELYDHSQDPYEWTNLADDPRFTDRKRELAEFLPTKDHPDAERKADPNKKAAAKKKAKAREKKKAD